MATITVPPGRTGKITLGGFSLYLAEWSMAIEIENEVYKHFEMDADANGLYWAGLLTGFCTGQAQVRGNFDNSAGSYLPTDKDFWLDQSGSSGLLGYTSLVGFRVHYTVTNVEAAQTTATPTGATFGGTIKITGCTFTTSGV